MTPFAYVRASVRAYGRVMMGEYVNSSHIMH